MRVGLYKAIIDLIPIHLEDKEFSEWILHVLRTGTCTGGTVAMRGTVMRHLTPCAEEIVHEELLKHAFVERASKVFARWPALQPYKRAFGNVLAITWSS